MLNRTNRTLSANLNRRDLGTRTIALHLQATTNMGPKSLRTRQSHPQAVVMSARAGIIPSHLAPETIGEPERPEIPGSTPESPWRTRSCAPGSKSEPLVFTDPYRPSVVLEDDRSRRFGVLARASRARVAFPGVMAGG